MSDFKSANIPETDLWTLNNCCIFLQVITLAGVTCHDGAHILPEVCSTNNKSTPYLSSVSSSKLNWPNQQTRDHGHGACGQV